MASTLHHLFLISSLLLCLFSTTYAAVPFRPRALILAVSKDDTTSQRIVKINLRTPPVSIPVKVDLQGKLLIVDCEGNKSSTKLPTDIVRINSTDGSNPGRLVSVPNFVFACGPGPAKGVIKGVAGLGRTKLSLPSQFSSAFKFVNKFAVCLSSSSFGDGFIIFGDKPYNLNLGSPIIEASTFLSYTPLIVNPVNPAAYFIGVTSIKISEKEVPINKALLSINSKGVGGTKISTVNPYTIVESSIYKALTTAFAKELEGSPNSRAKQVKAVAPFTVCYDPSTLSFSRVGVDAPTISLVMQNDKVVWTIPGTNSMVSVNSNAICLAFVDGGVNAKTAIVIGAYQLENNLLQFDLEKSRLGFSSSILASRGRCDNFNFTSSV